MRELGDLDTSVGVIYDLLEKGQEALADLNDRLVRTAKGEA